MINEIKLHNSDGKAVVAKGVSDNKILIIPINRADEFAYIREEDVKGSPYALLTGDMVYLTHTKDGIEFEYLVDAKNAYDRLDTIMKFAYLMREYVSTEKLSFSDARKVQDCICNFAYALMDISKEFSVEFSEDKSRLFVSEILIKRCMEKSLPNFGVGEPIKGKSRPLNTRPLVVQNISNLYDGMCDYANILNNSKLKNNDKQVQFEVSDGQSQL
ncbi:MAG: hypothetical protein IJZ26_00180 [Clostridia bacterium]|nr:hypothetical protein [Clostridia bacterium]MBQ9786021.1 hypothetical protein [Clostridia bacterium]